MTKPLNSNSAGSTAPIASRRHMLWTAALGMFVPATLVASNARARQELGWQPVRDLAQMVSDAWDFAQSRQ